MHCVQACLKTMLRYFDMPVLSFKELDKITGHKKGMFTWMSKTILWLANQEFEVYHVENLDYNRFVKEGELYLKTIWNKEVFDTQKAYSNLKIEQKIARKIIDNPNIIIKNKHLNIKDLKKLVGHNYFVMLSVNPFTLQDKDGYGSHLVVLMHFKNNRVQICDPDIGIYWIDKKSLIRAISKKYKPDFQATFVSNRKLH